MTSYAAVQSEPLVRLAVFLVVFTAVALWEVFAPRRTRSVARGVRWPHNLGLLLIDAAVLRILAPGAAIAVALAGEERGWGLLHGLPLPSWDRLFGTYRAQPAAGHEAMTIGVDAFRTPDELRLDRLLLQPLRDTPGRYPINRRQEAG